MEPHEVLNEFSFNKKELLSITKTVKTSSCADAIHRFFAIIYCNEFLEPLHIL